MNLHARQNQNRNTNLFRREIETDRQTDRRTDRQRQADTDRGRERDTERDRETHRQRDTQTETERQREREFFNLYVPSAEQVHLRKNHTFIITPYQVETQVNKTYKRKQIAHTSALSTVNSKHSQARTVNN